MNDKITFCVTLNSYTVNGIGMNMASSRRRDDSPVVYGSGGWLFDDGQSALWDNNGLVLTDK